MTEQQSQPANTPLPLDWQPPPLRKQSYVNRLTVGCLTMVVVGLLCLSGTVFVFDRTCVSNLSQLIPIYPGAQVLYEYHNFLSMYGMGQTVISLHSDDDENKVISWYARSIGAFRRQTIQDNSAGARLADGAFTVVPDDTAGHGSLISLSGKCASG